MNFLVGLVFGVLVAVGAAYVHDASLPEGPARQERALVNWTVFDGEMKTLREDLAQGWDRLTGRARSPQARARNVEEAEI
ncbi:MAG: hypothetical protein U1E28_00550 [Beijerinckiaceae bacterium]|mgnify:CR=1 FL=1